MLGDYTPPVPESECVTVLQGMKQEAPEGVEVSYAMGSEFSEADEDEKAKALALAAKSDVIVAVVGGSSSRFGGAVFDANGAASKGTGSRSMDCGEGMDTAKVHIPAAQEELVAELARLGKPMVTVVIAGRAYCIEDIENASNALLYAFIRVRWAARPLQRCSTEPRIRPAVSRYPCRATPVRFRCATITVPPSFRHTAI